MSPWFPLWLLSFGLFSQKLLAIFLKVLPSDIRAFTGNALELEHKPGDGIRAHTPHPQHRQERARAAHQVRRGTDAHRQRQELRLPFPRGPADEATHISWTGI